MCSVILYEDDEIRVVHRPGRSDFTLVSFAALGHRPKDDWVWAGPPAEKLGIQIVGFVGKRENWYPAASMRAAAPAVRAVLASRAVGYGFSMGAYAVLKYGAALGLTHGLAVSPQITIAPTEVPEDHRFHRYHDPLLHWDMAVRAGEGPPTLFIAGDPCWEPDAGHIRAAMAYNGARFVALPFMRHAAIDRFTSTPILATVLAQILADDAAALRAGLRRTRAGSAEWHLWVARTAEARGHRFARRLWDRAADLGTPTRKLIAVRGLAARERLILAYRRGGRKESLGLVDAVIAAQGGQVFGLLRLGELLLRRNMPHQAIRCFQLARHADPASIEAQDGLSRARQVANALSRAVSVSLSAAK